MGTIYPCHFHTIQYFINLYNLLKRGSGKGGTFFPWYSVTEHVRMARSCIKGGSDQTLRKASLLRG